MEAERETMGPQQGPPTTAQATEESMYYNVVLPTGEIISATDEAMEILLADMRVTPSDNQDMGKKVEEEEDITTGQKHPAHSAQPSFTALKITPEDTRRTTTSSTVEPLNHKDTRRITTSSTMEPLNHKDTCRTTTSSMARPVVTTGETTTVDNTSGDKRTDETAVRRGPGHSIGETRFPHNYK